jgi:hypothetical protein
MDSLVLEGLQLGVSLSLMARTTMEKIIMISNTVIISDIGSLSVETLHHRIGEIAK